jgi:serine/threonine-protein kinase
MIGKLLDHRYKIIRVLATGGFGETYIAEDTKRPGNPICVVKHLLPASSDLKIFDTAKRLFHSEAETLERLGNHDQIPRLLAYFDENHEFYLVQEFIEGHTLSEELVSEESWNESGVIQLLYEVLTVLEFVHQQGVIHRDIKPDNIIRRRGNNKLVLVDFGAVKQLRVPGSYPSRTLLGQSATVAIGTPGYMPTEQGQGKPRPNSDIYALGIIAVQALTGVAPVDLQEDHNTGEILWQDIVPVSPQLAAVLNKMIRYHFKERYQSASEALQALRVFAPMTIPVNEHPRSNYTDVRYPIVKVGSPQSRQKTVAVAPANQGMQYAAPAKPVRKDGAGFDFLQLLILALLAGGAAYVAPMLVKNAQGLATNWTKGNTLAAQTCTAVTNQTANIRSEPSSLDTATVIETVSDRTPLDVTGTRTKRGWIQVRLDLNKVAWVHSDVIGNKEEWVACLRDKSIAIKTINDSTLVASRPAPKPKPKSLVDWLPFPDNNEAKNKDKNKEINQIEPVPTTEAKPDNSQVVEQARQKYDSGDLQGAIALLKSIPAGIAETTKTISQWQQDWSKAEALFTDISDAVAQGKWDKVESYKDNPKKLPNIQYWRDKIEPMLKDAADNLAKQQIPQTGKPQRTERKINPKPENLKQDNPLQENSKLENSKLDNSVQENPKLDNPPQENPKQDNNFLNPEKLFNLGNP